MTNTLLTKYYLKEKFIDTEPKNTDLWCWESILIGRDVCLKGLDIQVWNGQQTCFRGNTIKRNKDDNKERLTKLNHFICPRSHSWKVKEMGESLNHNWDGKILERAFFVLEG